MKRVSFEVANALKEAGYPQEGDWWYSKDGKLSDWLMPHQQEIYAPTYLEAWLWLWREKGKFIDVIKDCNGTFIAFHGEDSTECCESSDPEDAIVKAIEHLVDNDLIK